MDFLNYIFSQEINKIITFVIFMAGVVIYTIIEYKEGE